MGSLVYRSPNTCGSQIFSILRISIGYHGLLLLFLKLIKHFLSIKEYTIVHRCGLIGRLVMSLVGLVISHEIEHGIMLEIMQPVMVLPQS